MEALLKVAEAATLQGVSVRWVRKQASGGHYAGVQIRTNAQNRPEYLIPLSALPEQAQKKYIDQHRPASAAAPMDKGKKETPAEARRVAARQNAMKSLCCCASWRSRNGRSA